VTTTAELARLRSERDQLRVGLQAERHAARHDNRYLCGTGEGQPQA
jgi:hypothetical protein